NNINIPPKNLTIAQQTTVVNMAGNLDGNDAAAINNNRMVPPPNAMFAANPAVSNLQAGGFVPVNPFANVTPDATSATTVYDSLGNQRQLTMWYLEDGTAANGNIKWAWYAFDTTGGAAPTNANCIGGSWLTTTQPTPNGIPAVPNATIYEDIQFNPDGSLCNNG